MTTGTTETQVTVTSETTIEVVTVGIPGADGADGEGGVLGGTTGQVLAKLSNDDHDTGWVEKQDPITLGTEEQYFRGDLSLANIPVSTLVNSIPFSAPSTVAVGNATIYLTTKAAFGGIINTLLAAQTTSGTITAAIKINGTNVTGLSAVAVTSTPADTNATAANTFAAGDIITLVTSSASSDLGLSFNLKYTRT